MIKSFKMHRGDPRNPNTSSTTDNSNSLNAVDATLSCLWVLTPLAASVSLLFVFLGMVTNQWLHTEEKMNNPSYNGTGEKDYLSKFTISGLWMFCFTNPGETLYDCNRIDYFSKEEYSPDPTDSTLAIPYTVTKSVMFFMVAGVLLCGGYLCSIIGQCVKHRTLYTFISGVSFIIAGLVMLLGLIMYISIFKSEIGSKLRPKSQLQPPAFEYWYGYSFLLYVLGLISTQITGISSIFLFIYKIQYEWKRKDYEDLKRGKRPIRPTNFYHYDPTMYYPCRRHPQSYVNSNSTIHHPNRSFQDHLLHQKRYFFSKEPLNDSPCSYHHSRSQSNSLKDIANFYDFPPPPAISYKFDESFNKDSLRHLPRDVTTNTVSTTADVNCDDYLNNGFDDFSPSIQHEHEFVTFDLDQPLSMRVPSSVSISSRGGNGRKNYETDTLRRTTPV